MSPRRNQRDNREHFFFPALTCAPPSHRPPPSGSPVHYLALALPFTSLLWTLVTRPCGRRWERSRSTKELTAINFAQATFTIIQRDSRLIAVTLSPRRALRPSRRPPLVLCEYQQADSRFVCVRGAERKRVGEEESHFCISKRCDETPQEEEYKRRVREGYRWPL